VAFLKGADCQENSEGEQVPNQITDLTEDTGFKNGAFWMLRLHSPFAQQVSISLKPAKRIGLELPQ
jgi:hypothetical protein